MCSNRSQLSFRCGILWEHWPDFPVIPDSPSFLYSCSFFMDSVVLDRDLVAFLIYGFDMGRGSL